MELLTVAATAGLLGVGQRAVRKAIVEQRLHATRIGRGWVIRREDIDRLLAPQVSAKNNNAAAGVTQTAALPAYPEGQT